MNTSTRPLELFQFKKDQPKPGVSMSATTVTGKVLSTKQFNGAWAIGDFFVDGEILKIKGDIVSQLRQNQDYTLYGSMSNHPKYGMSFSPTGFDPHVSLDTSAIEKYIINNFKGIGAKTAKKMINHIMGEDKSLSELEKFRLKMIKQPWTIDWSIVGKKGEFEFKSEDIESYIGRDLSTRIGAIRGISQSIINGISKFIYKAVAGDFNKAQDNIVSDAWLKFSSDPYYPARFIDGYGFKLADAIGNMLDFDKYSKERLSCLSWYALESNCDTSGHAFLNRAQLIDAIRDVDPRVDAIDAIGYCMDDGLILVKEDDANCERFYSKKIYDYEQTVAKGFHDLMKVNNPLYLNHHPITDSQIQGSFKKDNQGKSVVLDDSQIAAIKSILNSKNRLHVLTGGPGCGKTALVQTIVNLLPNSIFNFCAPTGKAAKVLSNRISSSGYEATTIHSLLKGGESGWAVNKDNPLGGNVLVVDEASMPSLELWAAIVQALPSHMHLLIVGDPNQLPSIQAGRVLLDVLEIPNINHSKLTTVHRNSGGILDVVNEVKESNLKTTDRDSVVFSHSLEDTAINEVINLYKHVVKKVGIENTALLMSRRKGDENIPGWNTDYANSVLKEEFNPRKFATPIIGTRFFINDRIIVKKNMRIKYDDDTKLYLGVDEARVVNGDTGTILNYSLEDNPKTSSIKYIDIKLDDGKLIKYPGEEVSHLQFSYALTVHAAQGSEYKEVIGVYTPGRPGFCNRNMLMTGLSRAKDKLYVYAEDSTLVKMAQTPLPKRNSYLIETMAEMVHQKKIENDEFDKKKANYSKYLSARSLM